MTVSLDMKLNNLLSFLAGLLTVESSLLGANVHVTTAAFTDNFVTNFFFTCYYRYVIVLLEYLIDTVKF